jgi:hypothetical protein
MAEFSFDKEIIPGLPSSSDLNLIEPENWKTG